MRAGESGEHRARQARAQAAELRIEAERLVARASELEGRAGKYRKGYEGERTIGALLDELRAEGWVVLHDRRRSPRSPANIDHVVVGPSGVYVIDAKKWSGLLRLDEQGMAVGRWRKDKELDSVRVDAETVGKAARALIPGTPSCGVLAFVGDVGLVGPTNHGGEVLLQQGELLAWLRARPQQLSALQIAEVGAGLDDFFPSRMSRPMSSRRRTSTRSAPVRTRRRGQRSPQPNVGRPPSPRDWRPPDTPAWRPQAPACPQEEGGGGARALVAVVGLVFLFLSVLPQLPTVAAWFGDQMASMIEQTVEEETSVPHPGPAEVGGGGAAP
jgi:hypothetical protein